MSSRRKLLQLPLAAFAGFVGPVMAKESDESEYDLVIIGSGAAGLASAVAAHEEGLSRILILEREPFIGGSSIVCGGQFSVAGTELQKSLGIHDTESGPGSRVCP